MRCVAVMQQSDTSSSRATPVAIAVTATGTSGIRALSLGARVATSTRAAATRAPRRKCSSADLHEVYPLLRLPLILNGKTEPRPGAPLGGPMPTLRRAGHGARAHRSCRAR